LESAKHATLVLMDSMERLLGAEAQNEIWRALAKSGLDPRSCHLSVSSLPGYAWQLIHQPSGYVFYGIVDRETIHFLRYSFNKRHELTPLSGQTQNWDALILEIAKWASETKAHVAHYQLREFNLSTAEAAYASDDNSRFTVAEQVEITNQLRMITESLKQNFKLSAEQMKHVQERLGEAEEASHRLGRKDWILLFSGAVFSLILTDIFTPGVAQHVLTMFIQGVGHLFTSGGGPIRDALHR